MDINEDERTWSRLDDGAIMFHARLEDTADEGLRPGRVHLVRCFWRQARTGMGPAASASIQAVAPAGAVRRSRQPGGGQQPRTSEHESDCMP